jgi:hypothetical protein
MNNVIVGSPGTRVRSTGVALALSYVVAQFLPEGLIHEISSRGLANIVESWP